jgi:hypothetical protein
LTERSVALTAQRSSAWTANVALLAAPAAFLLLHLAHMTFVDPDVWHQMALFREALALGHLPLADPFAYTPTIYPSVQHEWGTGALLYLVVDRLGEPGFVVLKYLLSGGVCAATYFCARKRGAHAIAVAALAPLAITAGMIGFTTIRAQVFTLLGLALLLLLIEFDRQGGRRWCWVGLPLFIAWLNLHAGFVVGAGVLLLHTAEQWCRGANVRHLVALLLAIGALVAVNPYGTEYYRYLLHGLLMPRPLISEWAPLWATDPGLFRAYLVSLLLVGYAASVIGPRRMAGLTILLVTAWLAARHTRHLSLYLVVWTAYLPAWLEQTPLGGLLSALWERWRPVVLVGCVAVTAFCLTRTAQAHPWQVWLPQRPEHEALGLPVYPVAAVDYLQAVDFRGRLMVPFIPGGYVIWRLHPHAQVSIDGRYEVAYQPGVLEENVAFYEARPGWQGTLEKYPTDAVLVPRTSAVAAELPALDGWQRVHRDDAFDVYMRGKPQPRLSGQP